MTKRSYNTKQFAKAAFIVLLKIAISTLIVLALICGLVWLFAHPTLAIVVLMGLVLIFIIATIYTLLFGDI